ncbi:uncharacterized protein [Fopius arisanus]|uniref:Iml1 protein n=1 Tax=Fopius arisanus TaxID=64838 RepID=A0A0C9RCM7_9HYME|nr:PREDICTED: uncharacterized protein LOC105267878 [Fopius arisanus]
MCGKVFIALMIIAISCDSSLGSSVDCANPAIWCQTEVTAKTCEKEEFCLIMRDQFYGKSQKVDTTTTPAPTTTSASVPLVALPPSSSTWFYVTPAPGRYTGLYPGGIFGK